MIASSRSLGYMHKGKARADLDITQRIAKRTQRRCDLAYVIVQCLEAESCSARGARAANAPKLRTPCCASSMALMAGAARASISMYTE